MKKFLAICLAVILVTSMSVVAFAKGGFIASPSGNAAPEIVSIEYEEDSCEPEVVVTPYSERDDLDKEKEDAMDSAYAEIAENKDLTKLCPELSAVAASLGIDFKNLAVSDLFDISAYHQVSHDYCGTIKITLSAETIKNFAALIHRNADGKWENIKDVVVDASENSISFSAKDFSPFAVVVDASADSVPNTGATVIVPAVIMVVSALSLAFILVVIKRKKQEA